MKMQKTAEWIDEMCEQIQDRNLKKLFRNCFLSTVSRAVQEKDDGSVYVSTGDIPAMWLRDSSLQMLPYIRLCNVDEDMKKLIKGVIRRQFFYINIDPYANAFNEECNGRGNRDDANQNDWVWERKFELDSLCFPFWLLEKYLDVTGDSSLLDENFVNAVRKTVAVFIAESNHAVNSDYTFVRVGQYAFDTLENQGKGGTTAVNGLVWSAFRPSDDKCRYGYFIPGNLFIVSVTDFLMRVFQKDESKSELYRQIKEIHEHVQRGLAECATVQNEANREIYVYETDGCGNYLIADDANVPSLLSVPMLGNTGFDKTVYQNTREYLLSSANPYYCEGKYAKGIGSPHTPANYIWHLGLLVQGLTATDRREKIEVMKMLLNTHGGTFHMHEGFHKDNPKQYTREWFGWADSFFAEFMLENFDLFKDIIFQGESID